MLKWYPKLLNDIYLSEAKPKIKNTIIHLFDNQEYVRGETKNKVYNQTYF